MGSSAFADGAFVDLDDATVHAQDLGFLNGDTVYDVVSVWNRRFFKLDAHLSRFENSARRWRMTIPHDRERLRLILAELVDRAGLEAAYVKVQLTRGRPVGHSRDPRRASQALSAFAIPYQWLWGEARCREGGRLHVSQVQRIPNAAIDARVKNHCRADFVQAQLDAFVRGCDDAVVLNRDGTLCEGIGWNICVVRGGEVATPRDNVLEGVTRSAVREICAREAIPFELRPVAVAELSAADEVFLTSTAGGVLPVIQVDGANVGDGAPGPVTRHLRDSYWSRREQGWHGTEVGEILGRPEAGSGRRNRAVDVWATVPEEPPLRP
jgi:branched-chain amino acid aminotransferase